MLKVLSEFFVKKCCTTVCPCCATLPFNKYIIWAVFDIFMCITKIALMVFANFEFTGYLDHKDQNVKAFMIAFKWWYILIIIIDILLIIGNIFLLF